MKFSAVIVTRGDVDLGAVIAPIVPLADELVIRRGHAGVYERWDAILTAKHDLVYTQDDDCIVDVAAMLAQSSPEALTCNMPAWKRPEYRDGTALVGWGAVVPKHLALWAILRYQESFEIDELFRRECDRAITGLSALHLVDVHFMNCNWANGPDRMCSRAGDTDHAAKRAAMLERIRVVRGELAAQA